jgi:hypothetical protein
MIKNPAIAIAFCLCIRFPYCIQHTCTNIDDSILFAGIRSYFLFQHSNQQSDKNSVAEIIFRNKTYAGLALHIATGKKTISPLFNYNAASTTITHSGKQTVCLYTAFSCKIRDA